MLGPLLFVLYINDIVKCIKNASCYLYADDLAILVSASDVGRIKMLLQEDLDAITVWCSLNRLTINTEKTKVLWCYSQRQKPDLAGCDLLVQNRTLSVVRDFNYLGVNIDYCLSFSSHGLKLKGMVSGKKAQLKHIRKTVDRGISMLVYKQMIRPIMEYSSFILDGASEWVPRRLQVLQNDCLRICERIRSAQDIDLDLLHARCKIEWLVDRCNTSLLSIMYKRANNVDLTVEPPRELRSSSKIKLKVERPKPEIFRKSPLYRGSMLWDELTADKQHKPTRLLFLASL